MNDLRTIYGYLERPFESTRNEQGKIEKGLIKVVFEEIDKRIFPINQALLFDEREDIFLLDGFETISSKHQGRLVKILAVPNANINTENQTKYVTFKKNISDFNKEDLISFIDYPLPDPLNLEVVLPDSPRTKIFYLTSDGMAYGPFILERPAGLLVDVSDREGRLKPMWGRSNGNPNLLVGNVFKFNIDELMKQNEQAFHKHADTTYLLEPNIITRLNNEQKELHPFVTQPFIIEILQLMKSKRVISAQTVTAVKKELNSSNIPPVAKEAVKAVVESAATVNDDWSRSIFEFIEDNEIGQDLINKGLSFQQAKYEKEWIEKIECKNQELVQTSKENSLEVDSVQKELALAKIELNKIESQIQDKLEQLQQDSGFEEEIKLRRVAADKELEEKRAELEAISQKYSELKTVEDLEDKLVILNEDLRSGHRQTDALDKTIKDLKARAADDDAILQSKLREIAPFVSSLIHAPMPNKNVVATYDIDENVQVVNEITTDLASDIVNGICTQFYREHDREYSNVFIASFLVAQQQNFLTMISGAPGLGKTSFVRILSKILGCGNRFKEVGVGRAWTSEREFIGFHNSLTNEYSPSSSGVYEYLRGIQEDEDKNVPPQIILLDEANLSPIEHYGAVLLNVADIESAKCISAGRDEIKLPQTLRITGTVNHDMTTEPLSARLIDRAPIIPFDVLTDNEETDFIETDVELNYSNKTFDAIFGCDSVLTSKITSIDAMDSVYSVLQDKKSEFGMPFVVSKRKQQNIKQYIEVLTPILASVCGLQYDKALTKACDYAVIYFLLPGIGGNGATVENRLKELSEALNTGNLTNAACKVEDMISRGKYHLDSFNYFNY